MGGHRITQPTTCPVATHLTKHYLELEGYRSARRGQYRVIYSLHEEQVLVRVVRTSHRVDVYG